MFVTSRASTSPRVEPERYVALLRAAHAISTCSDCATASDTLITELREVTPFDYLQVVGFNHDTGAPDWYLLQANGRRLALSGQDVPPLDETPMAWVYQSGELLVTDDWTEEIRFQKHGSFLDDLGIASTCTLPLTRGERRLGVLTVGRSYPHAYDEEEVGFLRQVAEQIGLAIDAAVNFKVSQRVQDRLKLILDLTNQVVSNLEFQELLRATSGSVRRVMQADAAAIMLPDGDGQHLRVHALDFPDSKGIFSEGALVPIEGTRPGHSFQSGKPMVVNRLDPATVPPEMYRKAVGEGLNSFCDMPLISRNRLLGILAVARREENTFDADQVTFMAQVAS
jgi:GAF domain-containing protein